MMLMMVVRMKRKKFKELLMNLQDNGFCYWGNVVIELGYATHIPTFVNTTQSGRRITVYKNIRFANPPVQDLRFRKPDTNISKIEVIQNGHVPWLSTDCIASAPVGAPIPGLNGTTWGHDDCLFLDVYVPETVRPGDNVPVLHFFSGGAYAFGGKDFWPNNPLGLFELGADFIFVTNNYRLGISGWASAPGLDMDANVGLLDCLAAAEWTSKYIARFGGDKDRITAMGQSSGAGIIQLLTVLNGGRGKLPFQRAFISSPDIPPRRNVSARQTNLFESILTSANCTTLACLRSAPESTIRRLNDDLINQMASDAGGGVFGPTPGFGPVPDGRAIPDMPAVLFRQGRYHRGLKGLIIGSMADEGNGLSHDTDQPQYFPTMVRQLLPNATDETIRQIQVLYDYQSNPAKLAWDWTTDVLFACNALNTARAFSSRAYRYIMSAPPATHGYDMSYYFHVDQQTTPVGNVIVAREFQHRLLRFIHGEETPWPGYNRRERLANITDGGFEMIALRDDLKKRCEVITAAVTDPMNGA
ncbi:putative lipase 2 [Dactylonectria estremocensis]|uniref:Lipase 2 n=1 Tax=Dactylonectria estremocensis TaxID=1079267 RepID=A0A9P9IN46_9HYPO|nr:putative lipase 2 [Dactylonectria estremocensis]